MLRRPPRRRDAAVSGWAAAVATGLWSCGSIFAVLMAATVSVSLLATLGDWRVLASTGASRAGLMIVAILVAGTSWWLVLGRVQQERRQISTTLLASAPGLLVFGLAATSGMWPLSERASWFFGGDHVRHLVYVAQIHSDGVLDYSTNAYPRAWHCLMALIWSAMGKSADVPGVLTLIKVMSLAVWLLHGLLSLTVGQLGAALGRRAGLAPRAAGVAGLVAGCLSLWPTFLSNYQILGFENSIVAMVLLVVAARELLERPSSLQCLVVNASVGAVMAHVWQLLLPVAAAGCAAAALGVLRRNRLHRPWVLVAGCLSALAAWPGISAALHRVGLESAVYASVPSPLPAVILPLSLVSLAALAVRLRADLRVRAFAAMVVSALVAALLVAWRVGIPVTQYYPSKMVWTAAVLCLAPLGVTTTQLLEAAWRLGGNLSSKVSRPAVGVVSFCFLIYSASAALFPLFGPSATADGQATLGALTAPRAAAADVVWLPGDTAEETRFDSTTARLMLDVFMARRGMSSRDQRSPSQAEECALLNDSAQPMVLSSASVQAVKRRYACVEGLTVIEVKPYRG